VADPRVGYATITSVETTSDLRHAKVWVSVIGQRAEREAAAAALQHAMPFIRHELGKTLRLKRIPDLHVHLDDTAERGTRILRLLADIETGSVPAPDGPIAESLPTPVPTTRPTSPIALPARSSTQSAARTLVEAGVFWSTMTLSSVETAAPDACCKRAVA